MKSFISESMSVEISFMYRGNNNVPRTVPCGTPDKTDPISEVYQEIVGTNMQILDLVHLLAPLEL